MPRKTISFDYDKVRDRQWYCGRLGELAVRLHLRLIAETRDTQRGLTLYELEAAVNDLWCPEEIRRLQAEGVFPLARDRAERLCRPVLVETYVFENAAQTVKMTIRAAERNEFPCLGQDIWLAKDLTLPGGFVTIEASDRVQVASIADEILAMRDSDV